MSTNYLNSELLKDSLKAYLTKCQFSNQKINNIVNALDDDPIHKYEDYMSEYVDDILIDDQLYEHYHCWFSSLGFEHETYYLKEDLIDKETATYLKAAKLFKLTEQ